jgi:hypothetical protein
VNASWLEDAVGVVDDVPWVAAVGGDVVVVAAEVVVVVDWTVIATDAVTPLVAPVATMV